MKTVFRSFSIYFFMIMSVSCLHKKVKSLKCRSMNKEKIVISNNPLIKEEYAAVGTARDYDIQLVDSKEQVFIAARDLIHKNWHLLNHTMVANIPIYLHPYRTLALQAGTELDSFSLALIERSIEELKKGKEPHYNEKTRKDFQDMDLTLFREVKL